LYNKEHIIRIKACTYPCRPSSDSGYRLGQPQRFGVVWNLTYSNTVVLEIHRNVHMLICRNSTLLACWCTWK